jgi:hypothetical protein
MRGSHEQALPTDWLRDLAPALALQDAQLAMRSRLRVLAAAAAAATKLPIHLTGFSVSAGTGACRGAGPGTARVPRPGSARSPTETASHCSALAGPPGPQPAGPFPSSPFPSSRAACSCCASAAGWRFELAVGRTLHIRIEKVFEATVGMHRCLPVYRHEGFPTMEAWIRVEAVFVILVLALTRFNGTRETAVSCSLPGSSSHCSPLIGWCQYK